MSEADIMLALNEALQKAGKGLDTRFCRVRYAPSGAISALLTEKRNAGLLIPRLSNLLIRAAKTVDPTVVRVEVLEHWQRLKVHGMSQERYLGAGKMELLKREVESSTGIELKAQPKLVLNSTSIYKTPAISDYPSIKKCRRPNSCFNESQRGNDAQVCFSVSTCQFLQANCSVRSCQRGQDFREGRKKRM